MTRVIRGGRELNDMLVSFMKIMLNCKRGFEEAELISGETIATL